MAGRERGISCLPYVLEEVVAHNLHGSDGAVTMSLKQPVKLA
jgi:hypothetical protein